MIKVKKLLRANSLRWQLVKRFLAILLLLLITMEIFQYFTMKSYLYSSKEQILDARFHNLDTDTFKGINSYQGLLQNSPQLINAVIDENVNAAVIDINGNRIDGRTQVKNFYEIEDNKRYKRLEKPMPIPGLSKDEYKNLLKTKGTLEGYKLFKDKNGDLQIIGFRKIGNLDSPIGLVQLSMSAAQVEDILYNQKNIFIIASLLILIIGAIVGSKVFKYTLKPLYNMKDNVEHVDAAKLDRYLSSDSGQIEIDSLANAFNNMLDRIDTSFKEEQRIREKMRQFVSDASHELRTPLTSIHGFVEVLLRGAAKNEEQLDMALNSILIESERLTKLVNDLLLLNRLDQKMSKEIQSENIKDVIDEVIPQIKILLGERKIKLDLDDNAFVYINKNQIKQVIFNLVQNAVRHTDEKLGEIIISAKSSKNYSNKYVLLKIKDNGTGISEENIEKIFDRFFRSEKHRSRKYGGYGLGLSIVKSIIDAHDGKIEVKSEVGVGTTFYIFLPKEVAER